MMATHNQPTKAQIDEVVELMGETGIDLIGVIEYVLRETRLFNLEKEEILAWFPAEFLDVALAYLSQEKKAQHAE
jgi:hypothetical protein